MRLDPITLTACLHIPQRCVRHSLQRLLCQVDAFKKHTIWFQTLWIRRAVPLTAQHTVMPDDHSKLVPLLPIPNRTVKRLCADDSAATSVKVGHRQAFIPASPVFSTEYGAFAFIAPQILNYSYLFRFACALLFFRPTFPLVCHLLTNFLFIIESTHCIRYLIAIILVCK